MNVLMLARRIAPPGGAERSAMTLARRLNTDHRTMVCGYGLEDADPPQEPSLELRSVRVTDRTRIPVELGRLCRYTELPLRFRRVADSFEPDIVFSQHEQSLLGARLRATRNVPHVLFVHDGSVLPVWGRGGNPLTKTINSLSIPLSSLVFRYVLAHTDLVVANSEYMKQRVDRQWGTDAAVVYPFIEPESVRTESTGEKILHVTPTHHKGIDLTLDIASTMLDQSFIIVGTDPPASISDRIADLENVSYRNYQSNMRSVYRETKVVLMPTQAPESFGMVPVEAGINGIPTVHSGRGGLNEAAGEERLAVSKDNPDAYVRRLREVLAAYDEYSMSVRKHAEQKTVHTQVSRLRSLLAERLAVSL